MSAQDNKNSKTECKHPVLHYAGLTADFINDLRILPRVIVIGYMWVFWDTSQWFMGLEDPTGTQAAFVSTIVGAGAGFFGLYIRGGKE